MNTRRIINSIASCIGYASGLEKGLPYGVVDMDVLKEGDALKTLFDELDKIENKPQKMEEALNNYKERRVTYENTLFDFSMLSIEKMKELDKQKKQ